MSKRTSIIFKSSIALNVLLVAIVVWGYFNTVYVTERFLAVNVAGPCLAWRVKLPTKSRMIGLIQV